MKRLVTTFVIASAFLSVQTNAALPSAKSPTNEQQLNPQEKNMLKMIDALLKTPKSRPVVEQIVKSYEYGKRTIAALDLVINSKAVIADETERTTIIREAFFEESGKDFLQVLVEKRHMFMQLVKKLLHMQAERPSDGFILEKYLSLTKVDQIDPFFNEITTFQKLRGFLYELVVLVDGLRANLISGATMFDQAAQRIGSIDFQSTSIAQALPPETLRSENPAVGG